MTIHKCDMCKFSTTYSWVYKKHLTSQRHLRNDMHLAQQILHKCDVCGYSTYRKSDYNKHMKIHSEPDNEPKIISRLKRLRVCMIKIKNDDVPELKAKLTEQCNRMLEKLEMTEKGKKEESEEKK